MPFTGSDAHFNIDVVARNDGLPSNWADLNLDIDDAQGLRAHVDFRQTRIDSLVEFSESRDQADSTCDHGLRHNQDVL